jgi:holin-like protein
MINALLTLLFCQLIGEAAARGLALPVPGPVLGMLLLFMLLRLQPQRLEQLAPTADGLLARLSLLFVPAGVGVMVYLPLLAGEGAVLLLTLILSTAVTIAVTGLTLRLLRRKDTDGRRTTK